MTALRLTTIALLAFAAHAAGQPAPAKPPSSTVVYKCTNPDGSVVYAQTPCSSDPGKVQTVDTAPALRTGSGGYQGEIAASVADSDCREQAYKSTHADAARVAESNRHIADYRQRRQSLVSQPNYADANGNVPDNTRALADIDSAIAAEQQYQEKTAANNEATYQEALKHCAEALRKATQPPAPAAPAKGKEGGGG